MINLKTKDWCISDIDTVLFDKDGTFIDLHYFWGKMTELRAMEVIRRFGLRAENVEKLCRYLGYDMYAGKMLQDGITALYSRQRIIEIFRGNLVELGVCATDEELARIFDYVSLGFYKEIEKYTKPIESAIEFIKGLKCAGINLGIVTSDSVDSTSLTLELFGWSELFDVVIGRESCSAPKESGEPTSMAIDMLGAEKESTVMIGDAPTDYISAKRAGIEKTILVATGQVSSEELKIFSEFVVSDLAKIKIV